MEASVLLELNYDLVISDFEPISAWASKRKNVLCVGSSHQYSFKSKKVPKPKEKSYHKNLGLQPNQLL